MLVARHGKPVFTDVRGLQDREGKIPNRLDTRFNLGSMNKMFTAVAVAQLAQQGKLAFSDPVGKHIPDYPNAEVAKKVTIHHLLSHTGGTGDIFGPEFTCNQETLKDPKDYVALYGKRAPAFEPGARFAYSNYGMVLAGVIVERVSGMSYYDYVRKNVYARVGMNASGSFWKTEKRPISPGATPLRKGRRAITTTRCRCAARQPGAGIRPARTSCASPPPSPATSCSTPSTRSCSPRPDRIDSQARAMATGSASPARAGCVASERRWRAGYQCRPEDIP